MQKDGVRLDRGLIWVNCSDSVPRDPRRPYEVKRLMKWVIIVDWGHWCRRKNFVQEGKQEVLWWKKTKRKIKMSEGRFKVHNLKEFPIRI